MRFRVKSSVISVMKGLGFELNKERYCIPIPEGVGVTPFCVSKNPNPIESSDGKCVGSYPIDASYALSSSNVGLSLPWPHGAWSRIYFKTARYPKGKNF